MATIKKAFQPIVDILTANPDKKVKDILAQVTELASAKVANAGSASIRDAEGKVVAILDYYFKRWMPLVGDKAVEFGAKQGTPTGFNSMSKAGTSAWTKQQRAAKTANEQLLADVVAKKVAPENLQAELDKIEAQRKSIEKTDLGFETEEQVREYLKKNGVKLAA